MFLLRRPSDTQIRIFLEQQSKLHPSYPEVGASRYGAPLWYPINRGRVKLGAGEATFRRAVTAMQRWQMYNLSWTWLCWPDTPIRVGTTFGVVVYHLGFWSLHACRIVYVIEEQGATERYGFAIGTLPDHAEQGEERFSIEWRHDDDSVWYDVFAFARPHHVLSVLGYPFVRITQRRFASESQRAMLTAVAEGAGS